MVSFQLNWCCHYHFKNGLCATLLFTHVLEAWVPSRSRHIWTRSRKLAPTLFAMAAGISRMRAYCSTLRRAVPPGYRACCGKQWAPQCPELKPLYYWFWGACKHSVYRNKPGSPEELCLSVEQYVREVPADTAGGEGGASSLERVQMCLERGGACTLRTCANKRVAHNPFLKWWWQHQFDWNFSIPLVSYNFSNDLLKPY